MIQKYVYGQVPNSEIFKRDNIAPDVEDVVKGIVADVRQNGDEALFRLSAKFDKAELSSLEVSREEMDEALSLVEPAFMQVLEEAAKNIRIFHEKQVRNGFMFSPSEGVLLGQKIIPIEKVGVYVPGGTAPLSSTVLMDVIPAKIAGCSEIIMVTPPQKNGKVDPSILAAAYVAGATRIFKVGGAQAVAALAYGTQSIPKVDKIVGPGNAYVAEAKKQVFGVVSIDMVAGPSDILVLADGNSDPELVAADLLSQAEHDVMACAVLVTDSEKLADAVALEVERQLQLLPRQDIARRSIENNGKIIVAEGNLDLGVTIANEIAPEHLELCVDDPFRYLGQIRNAGSVFMGRSCPESLGDYFAGPNHTLPTSGTARFSSPLSVDDFIKKTQYTYYTPEALDKVAAKVDAFAKKEGLEAHARSATLRAGKKECK